MNRYELSAEDPSGQEFMAKYKSFLGHPCASFQGSKDCGNLMKSYGIDSEEQEVMNDYLEDFDRDKARFNGIKDSMKRLFFKIHEGKGQQLRRQPKITGSPPNPEQSLESSIFLTDRRGLSSKLDYSNQFTRVLENSRVKEGRTLRKVQTKSELDRKNKKMMDEERSLILKFIKRKSSEEMKHKEWSDLTNKDKYEMNFSFYIRKKRKSQIEKCVYQKEIQKKTKPLEKFQDFILDEVKFSKDNREKLTKIFLGIRSEFKHHQKLPAIL